MEIEKNDERSANNSPQKQRKVDKPEGVPQEIWVALSALMNPMKDTMDKVAEDQTAFRIEFEDYKNENNNKFEEMERRQAKLETDIWARVYSNAPGAASASSGPSAPKSHPGGPPPQQPQQQPFQQPQQAQNPYAAKFGGLASPAPVSTSPFMRPPSEPQWPTTTPNFGSNAQRYNGAQIVASLGGWDYDTAKDEITKDLERIKALLCAQTREKVKRWDSGGIRASTARATFHPQFSIADLWGLKEELDERTAATNFTLANGNSLFIAPLKTREQVIIDKSMSFIFLGMCFLRDLQFRKGEIQKVRARAVGLERAWAPWNVIWVDGNRVAMWDDSQGEVVLNDVKLAAIGWNKVSVWDAAQRAEVARTRGR